MKSYHDIAGDGGSDIVRQVQTQHRALQERLASITYLVGVMSGKGGVGKSSVTVNLAGALAEQGWRVGILDADINGPSVARLLGVRDQPLRETPAGIQPVCAAAGIQIMSIDLFLSREESPVLWNAPTQKDAYTWRGMMEALALREMLADTCWGDLDLLLIDLPPGSDKLPNLVDILPRFTGCLTITQPAAISQFVVGKAVAMARDWFQTPILGLVINMASHVCPHCGQEEALFPVEDLEALSRRWQLPVLARLPFDAEFSRTADRGRLFVLEHPEAPLSVALNQLAGRLRTRLKALAKQGSKPTT